MTRRRIAALLLVLVAACAGASGTESEEVWVGRPLIDALQELRSRGLNLVFSSDLVRAGMTVVEEPSASSLHRMLEQILLPHGLEAQIGPQGSVLVVKRWPETLLVTIDSPPAFHSVIGPVEFAARVSGKEAIDRLEFRVDGELREIVRRPPYRTVIDVGEDNSDHRFEVVAHGRWGGSGYASVTTRGWSVADEVEVVLKQLFVSVRGQDGRPMLDLGRESFAIFEGDERQELVTFERGDVPITAVLLVDASESMKGGALAAALEGAREFLSGLARLDEAMVMLFSDRTLAATEFSNNRSQLLAKLDGVEASGGTALNDHLYAALRLLDQRRGRRVVVLVSDGADVLSALRMEEVRWKIQRSDTLIYWIRLDQREQTSFSSAWRNFEQNRREWDALESAVVESGGRIEPLDDVSDIEAALAGVMRELRDQYVLGYYPSDRRRDGGWREVRVRVDDGRATVRFRSGYVDL